MGRFSPNPSLAAGLDGVLHQSANISGSFQRTGVDIPAVGAIRERLQGTGLQFGQYGIAVLVSHVTTFLVADEAALVGADSNPNDVDVALGQLGEAALPALGTAFPIAQHDEITVPVVGFSESFQR